MDFKELRNMDLVEDFAEHLKLNVESVNGVKGGSD